MRRVRDAMAEIVDNTTIADATAAAAEDGVIAGLVTGEDLIPG